jgi:hypothetical protein
MIELSYSFVHMFNKVAVHQLFHEDLAFETSDRLDNVASHEAQPFGYLQFIEASQHHVGISIHRVQFVFVEPRQHEGFLLRLRQEHKVGIVFRLGDWQHKKGRIASILYQLAV